MTTSAIVTVHIATLRRIFCVRCRTGYSFHRYLHFFVPPRRYRDFVGRIATTGSVTLTSKMQVERYSHVMHIVSNVTGEVADDLDAIDVLRATFPAGTVSGAPKVRAMEIIGELEPEGRGIYAGAVGYIGWNGNMDTAIAIRTAIIADGELHIQAGAGIVADSIAANEWQETMNKGRAIFRAVAMAVAGLDPDVLEV